MTDHVCKESELVEYFATPAHPYHYLDSGLSNVYLSGIKYWKCKACGAVAAEIPAPTQLMNVIAESIVMKPGLLHGSEIKFLRKRAGKKANDFAELIGKSPEHFSKLETGRLALTEPLDKLIRMTYGMLSDDQAIRAEILKNVEAWLKSIHKRREVTPIKIKKSKDDNWERLPVAA